MIVRGLGSERTGPKDLRKAREESMMNHEESGYRKSISMITVRKMDDISCVSTQTFRVSVAEYLQNKSHQPHHLFI
jgi:hypothetical protein